MTIISFADKYKLPIKPVCGEKIIPGKYGHIYPYKPGLFMAMIIPDEESTKPMTNHWEKCRRIFKRNKFALFMDCEGEGIAAFSPEEPFQVKIALRLVGVKKRRAVKR